MIDIKQNAFLLSVVGVMVLLMLGMGGVFNTKMESLQQQEVWEQVEEYLGKEEIETGKVGFLIMNKGCENCDEIEAQWESLTAQSGDLGSFEVISEESELKNYLLSLAKSASYPTPVEAPHVLGIDKSAGVVVSRSAYDEESVPQLLYRLGAPAEDMEQESDSSGFTINFEF